VSQRVLVQFSAGSAVIHLGCQNRYQLPETHILNTKLLWRST
jgi:hypothetical protein